MENVAGDDRFGAVRELLEIANFQRHRIGLDRAVNGIVVTRGCDIVSQFDGDLNICVEIRLRVS
jgi:hypothetical protein